MDSTRILGVLEHTPLWVWCVLAVLVVTGLQATRQRVVPVWRLLLVPAVFIVWGVSGIIQRASVTPSLAFDWVGALAIGTALGWGTVRLHRFVFENDGGTVRVPGSPMPLVRNALIFSARYGLAVAAAFTVEPAAHAQLVVIDVAVSGLATGYFLGWLIRFAQARQAGATSALDSQSNSASVAT